MNKSALLIKLLVSFAIIFSANVATATIYHSSVNGATCKAANQNQAFGLAWNHARISNNTTVDRWIACAVPRSIDFVDTASIYDYFYDNGTRISVWFGAGSAVNAEITCIVREMAIDVTDTVPVSSVTVVSNTTQTLPATENMSLSFSSFTDNSAQFTLVCKLPPQTGINTIRLTSGIVTP